MRNDKGWIYLHASPAAPLSTTRRTVLCYMRVEDRDALPLRSSTTTASLPPWQAATPANELGQKIQHRVSKGGRTLRLNIQVKDCHGRVREGYLRAPINKLITYGPLILVVVVG